MAYPRLWWFNKTKLLDQSFLIIYLVMLLPLKNADERLCSNSLTSEWIEFTCTLIYMQFSDSAFVHRTFSGMVAFEKQSWANKSCCCCQLLGFPCWVWHFCLCNFKQFSVKSYLRYAAYKIWMMLKFVETSCWILQLSSI